MNSPRQRIETTEQTNSSSTPRKPLFQRQRTKTICFGKGVIETDNQLTQSFSTPTTSTNSTPTSLRSSTKDTTVVLKAPRILSLEACLEFINDDELVEITPKSVKKTVKYHLTVFYYYGIIINGLLGKKP